MKWWKYFLGQRGTVTGSEGFVVQRFKQTSNDATSATLIPATASWGEAKPTHLAATQVVFTYTALPPNLFGATTDDMEYEITIRRVG